MSENLLYYVSNKSVSMTLTLKSDVTVKVLKTTKNKSNSKNTKSNSKSALTD